MDCEAVNCRKLPSREASCSPTPLRGARAPCQDLPTFLKATVSGPADRPGWGRERHFSGNPESLTSLSQKPHWRGDSGGLEKRTVPPAGHQSLGEGGAAGTIRGRFQGTRGSSFIRDGLVCLIVEGRVLLLHAFPIILQWLRGGRVSPSSCAWRGRRREGGSELAPQSLVLGPSRPC